MSKVSVIIPCYNHAQYLSRAVHSVLAQTYQDWEAIIVDDGSKDNTREVAIKFNDARLQYYYQQNQGLSNARNVGIRNTTGEYLAFLDADDIWEPEFLSRCITELHSSFDLSGVYTRAVYINEQDHLLPQPCGIIVPPDRFRTQLIQGGFFPVHAVLVKRDVIYEAGLFDPQLAGLADWDLWLTIAAQHTFRGIDMPLVHYRVVANSMSMQSESMHQNRLIVLNKHFGDHVGDIATWSPEKRRAYGYAYRATAYDYIQQKDPEKGKAHFREAIRYWEHLLSSPETFYELICAAQPRGYQGQAQLLNLDAARVELIKYVKSLLRERNLDLIKWYRRAYGNAWVALTMLNEQAGRKKAAQKCLTAALLTNPRWILLPSYRGWWVDLTRQRLHVTKTRFLCDQHKPGSQSQKRLKSQ